MVYSIIQKSQLEGALRLDAEYYQPEYLHSMDILIKKGAKPLSKLAKEIVCGPFGSAILQGDYKPEGVPLIRVADLNDWFVRDDDLVFIEKSLSQKMERYQVVDGDLVVSQRGTIAMFSKVTNRFPKWNISANLISIKKSENIDFNYLLTFLNSKYGIAQLYRRLSGQVQPKITTDDVKQIIIFVPSAGEQKEVSNLLQEAWQEQEDSKSFYFQAEDLLLEELGLKDFKIEDGLSYVVNLSDVKSAHRADAEYFQPKYSKIVHSFGKDKKLLKIITGRKTKKIKIIKEKDYGYIEISDVDVGSGEVSFNVMRGFELPANAKMRIDGGELMVSKVRPTRGAIAIIPDSWNKDFVASGAFSIFEVESPLREYLQVVLRSIIGKLQLEKPTTGTSYPTITDQDVENLLIPILPQPFQQKISSLIQESFKLRREAKELLKQAKQKVEELIEK